MLEGEVMVCEGLDARLCVVIIGKLMSPDALSGDGDRFRCMESGRDAESILVGTV